MKQHELRNIIVQMLYDYLGGPKVILSDQVMPESEYPYIYYQSVQQHIPGPYNICRHSDGEVITAVRHEQATCTYSFTACSVNRKDDNGNKISGDNEALSLADKAQGFFVFTGKRQLAAEGIVVVDVQNTQSRSAFNVDETDRRYGFDVLFRYERTDSRVVPRMEQPITIIPREEL